MHQSIATIHSPEFLNLHPNNINPLISECEIKVLYIGDNRNRTSISKETATKMGQNLRGAPIVGYYKQEKEDFIDHGEVVIIDDEGIHFECKTVPYGFVSPNAEVWFQDFEDTDERGNKVVHTYLMTTGYLWTKQFPQAEVIINEGRPQSMELYSPQVEGKWDEQSNIFIIDDAIISKLCILGDDVQPCFEGASIGKRQQNITYTLDEDFKKTLYSMMQDLKEVLGGTSKMGTEEKNEVVETVFEATEDVIEESSKEVTDMVEDSYEKKEEEAAATKDKEEEEEEEPVNEKKEEDNSEETSKEYALLTEAFEALQEQYSKLKTQYDELLAFKVEIDNQKKDELIAEFYMLSDEDKADVIQNKEKYTFDEIKSKLSVLCFDKKISFSRIEETIDKEDTPIVTYGLQDQIETLPDWVKEVKTFMK